MARHSTREAGLCVLRADRTCLAALCESRVERCAWVATFVVDWCTLAAPNGASASVEKLRWYVCVLWLTVALCSRSSSWKGGRGGRMGSPQLEELKHIIVQHVAKEHRDRALLLLNAIEQRRSGRSLPASFS